MPTPDSTNPPDRRVDEGAMGTADARNATVAVVGAGMSGLVAARTLRQQGVDVVVLEAADRVGGRMLAETTPLGSRLDLGGQWLGHGHHRFEALAAEMGATSYAMDTPRQPDFIRGGERLAALGPPMLTATVALLRWELGARGRKQPRRWATRTVRDWLEARVPSSTARRALDVLVAASTCADTDGYSMQSFADVIRHQGGLTGMVKTSGGAQERLLVEGAGTLTDRLAQELGSRVLTGHRVTRLEYDEDGATVHTPGMVVRVTRVIVTVPPPLTGSIAFQPALPVARTRLVENTTMGTVYKAIAVYERPFWRDTRPHAEFIVLDEPGAAVFDTSPPEGPGHLCVLVAGAEARALDTLTADERRARIFEPLTHHLGAQVARPMSWHEKAWHLDEYVGGGYAALPKLGTREGTFPFPRDPIGPIHWGGTETATEHAGYIEGAIESGHRVANEVRLALGTA